MVKLLFVNHMVSNQAYTAPQIHPLEFNFKEDIVQRVSRFDSKNNTEIFEWDDIVEL